MKTIFKKSLAMAVCVALCLTAFIGCLTVSATGTATAVISTENVTTSDTSANVTVTVTGSANVSGFRFDIVADATKVTIGTVADGANYSVDQSTPATNTTRFVVLADDVSTGLASVTITLPCTLVAPVAAGTIAIEGGELAEIANATDETLMTTTWTDGAIVVAAAHVHDFSGAWQYDATNHWKVCPTDSEIGELAAHTWGEWVETTPATTTTPGVETATCSVCGATKTQEIPVLTPAEPVVDSNIVFANVSAGLASTSVQFSFRLRQNVMASYADFDMVLVPDKYDTTDFDLVENPTEIVVNKTDFATPNATFYNYAYTDIQLYELGLNIQYYIKAYDANGNYVARSEYYNISPAEAIKTLIGQTSNAKMKTALVDLLVVCDEAAQLFGANYPESDLANAASVLTGVDLSLATPSTPDLAVVDGFEASNANFGTASTSTYRVLMSASVQKVPVLTYRLGDKAANRIDTSKLSMTISYTSVDNTSHTVTVSGDDWVRSGNFISYNYDDIGLHDSATTITAVATYDGQPAFTKTYTVETFLNNNLANATLGDMMNALAKFGYSFRDLMGL